jgi:hypothetical protein
MRILYHGHGTHRYLEINSIFEQEVVSYCGVTLFYSWIAGCISVAQSYTEQLPELTSQRVRETQELTFGRARRRAVPHGSVVRESGRVASVRDAGPRLLIGGSRHVDYPGRAGKCAEFKHAGSTSW